MKRGAERGECSGMTEGRSSKPEPMETPGQTADPATERGLSGLKRRLANTPFLANIPFLERSPLFKHWRGGGSLTARIIIAAGLWLGVALLVGGLLLSFAFRTAVERHFDARLSMLLESLIGASNVGGEGLVSLYRSMMDPRFDRPYSGWYWQISASGEMPFRSRSLWDQEIMVDLGERLEQEVYFVTDGPEEQMLRAVARDIRLPRSDRIYRFIVAGEVSEIDDQVRAFNQTLTWWLAILGVILLTTMAIQVRYGLKPLRRISTALSAIRSGEKTALEDDFPREIEPLVQELNALIAHNAEVVDRAQKHVGNLAHALKTPLAVMTNEAQRNAGPFADLVQRQADLMTRHVDHHLARARAAARRSAIGSRSAVAPAIHDLVRVMRRIYVDRNLTFDIVLEDPGGEALMFRGARQDLDEMLGNLLDNAAKWAESRVVVRLGRDDQMVTVTIEDDGPGISPEKRDMVFTRGERIDETVPGSGLGLGIVKDLADLCGGAIALESAEGGGLRAILRLPRAV